MTNYEEIFGNIINNSVNMIDSETDFGLTAIAGIMSLPDDLFDIMVKYIFNEAINNKECYNRLWDGMTIQCREENKIKQMSNITFIINNHLTTKSKSIFILI